MTDEFQKGLITGLAMKPLQVTTEHATPDPGSTSVGEIIAGTYIINKNAIVAGEVVVIPLISEVT